MNYVELKLYESRKKRRVKLLFKKESSTAYGNSGNVIGRRKSSTREQNPAAFLPFLVAVVSESISVEPRLERRVNTAECKSRTNIAE